MRSVFVGCVLICAATVAFAEDVEQEIWLYELAGATRHLDVTELDDDTKLALHAQMLERGFQRVAVDVVIADEQFPIEESRKSLREDLKVLLRNGGRFPEGYEPAASREPGDSLRAVYPRDLPQGVGALLLKYLRVKDDERRAPIYESVLKALAKVLRDGTGAEAVRQWLEMKYLDPDDGEIYAEILHTLSGFGDGFAGAEIAFVVSTPLAEDSMAIRLGAVPTGSNAHRMGLREGDAILEIDGEYPTSPVLAAAERRIQAGSKLRLRVRRKDGKMERLGPESEADPETPNSGDK